IDGSVLSGQDRLSYEIFLRDLRMQLEGERFPGWMQPVNQFYSFSSFLPQLASGRGAQPFKTVQDYDNWLARGNAAVAMFDTAIANMREGMAAGVVQPKVLMEKVLPQLSAIIVDDPEKSLFWGPVTMMPEEFPAEDKARLTAA